MGQNYSEIIRGIVIAYLSEKGYMEKERDTLGGGRKDGVSL